MANHTPKILFIRSRSFVFLLIAVIISILILGYLYIFFNSIHYSNKEGVSLGNYKRIEEINFSKNSTIDIKQEIYSRLDNFGKIAISLQATDITTLNVLLKDKPSGNIVRQTNLSTQLTDGNIEILEWTFEPITDSHDTNYIIQISFLSNSDLIFYAVTPDRYDGGDLYINNKKNEDLRLIIDWEYYSSNPIRNIYSRLPFFKPGLFNYSITYVILTIMFFILQTLLVWRFLNLFFNSKNES